MAKPRGELDLIQRIRAATGPARGAVQLGIGDDCAIVRPPAGHDLLVTTDFSLESRHFCRDWHPARSAGHRCLARGLSDLAAMGAKPISAFLSLAVPAEMRSTRAGERWLGGFVEGLLALAQATGTQLSGGDTAAAPGPHLLADIVLLGSAPRGRALRRSGARPGDLLYVTGALGGSAAELKALADRPSDFRRASNGGSHPHLYPSPRLRIGQTLVRRGLATAAIDLSDGLSTDLHHLCSESQVGGVIDAEAVPLHPLLLKTGGESLPTALHGGEDYELLFTAPADTKVPGTIGGVPLTRIGRITSEREVLLRTGARLELLQARGWEHAL